MPKTIAVRNSTIHLADSLLQKLGSEIQATLTSGYKISNFCLALSALKPGQWLKCEETLERGEVQFFNGKTVCISLGDGITLYTTPVGLEILGWEFLTDEKKKES